MPAKQGRASRFLGVAVLLLVLAIGGIVDAVLAHELLKRQHLWTVHHPTIDMRLRHPGEQAAPPHPGRGPYHHRRAPLTAGNMGTRAVEA